MTGRLATVQNRIATVRQLGMVVNAMRGIAGARAQQARALLPAIEAYAETALGAVRRARALGERRGGEPHAPRRGRPILILFGAEQGFAGAYPEQLAHVLEEEGDDADLFLIGQRAGVLAAQHGREIVWRADLPSRADALAGLASTIVEALFARLGGADRPVPVRIAHGRCTGTGGTAIVRRPLLPLDDGDAPAVHVPPIINLLPAILLERLAQEYVFAAICAAACQAFSAENEARAATMATAKRHIDDKLTALQDEERLTRQEELTAEVIELAAGARRNPRTKMRGDGGEGPGAGLAG